MAYLTEIIILLFFNIFKSQYIWYLVFKCSKPNDNISNSFMVDDNTTHLNFWYKSGVRCTLDNV